MTTWTDDSPVQIKGPGIGDFHFGKIVYSLSRSAVAVLLRSVIHLDEINITPVIPRQFLADEYFQSLGFPTNRSSAATAERMMNNLAHQLTCTNEKVRHR